MKKMSSIGMVTILIIAIIPVIYLAIIYTTLPQTIALHFDLYGKPNGFGNKVTLCYLVLFMSALTIGIYLLIKNLPKIDPKKTAGQSPELFNKIAILLVVFLTGLNIVIVYSSVIGSFQFSKLLLPMMGLLFALMGNYMHSIKPNYFVGFRLPWTLEDEDNWRKTHQLSSKLWVQGGLLITVVCLILPIHFAFIFFFLCMLIMTIIPIIFSYRLYKRNTTHK